MMFIGMRGNYLEDDNSSIKKQFDECVCKSYEATINKDQIRIVLKVE